MQYVCACACVWYWTGDKTDKLKKKDSCTDTCGCISFILASVSWSTVIHTSKLIHCSVNGNWGITSALLLWTVILHPYPTPVHVSWSRCKSFFQVCTEEWDCWARGIASSTWLENLKLFFRTAIPIYIPLSAQVSADLHPCQHLVVSGSTTFVNLLCTDGTHGGFCISWMLMG